MRQRPSSLGERIRRLAGEEGIGHWGVADLRPALTAVLEQGGSLVDGYPRAVSLGIALPGPVVDLLPGREQRAVRVLYRHHAYDLINLRLDLAASRVSGVLQAAGYRALPIPASLRVDDERLRASFSHKLAARLAGLGWIGRSCLLVTPRDGPRVRWATVLTDAPLPAGGAPPADGCGECRQCVDICPAGAFTGRPFRQEEPREARYDARRCARYFDRMEKEGGPAVCGLCLYVCPPGRPNT
jgi:epoxyqueuosine reductase QueG